MVVSRNGFYKAFRIAASSASTTLSSGSFSCKASQTTIVPILKSFVQRDLDHQSLKHESQLL